MYLLSSVNVYLHCIYNVVIVIEIKFYSILFYSILIAVDFWFLILSYTFVIDVLRA